MPNITTTNRLIEESSPYLLQHAYNPVDWFPWGKEAFDRAEAEDKPIFLSIGYSSCHWCHVMERESFEDEEVAELLNKAFISVKVDREERPDVDHFYMQACQRISGGGGWPLTALLTPDKKPFFAGTYYPKPVLLKLLSRVRGMWRADRDSLADAAENVTLSTTERFTKGEGSKLPVDAAAEAARHLMSMFDGKYGGFGTAPKFPSPHNLLLLMRVARSRPINSEIWQAVSKTLTAMARGGLRDHLGGGFCRYSTDKKWIVPHFEKMLYDHALLMMAYTEHYQKTGDPDSGAIVRETAEYILREMTEPQTGLFYTAQDADTEGVEGLFYTFTPKEISEALGNDAQRFCDSFDVIPGGHLDGRSVPNLIETPNVPLFDPAFTDLRKRLLDYRSKRTAPFRDEKSLLTSNSLMAAAFAKAGAAFGRDDYRKVSARAIQFILRHMQVMDENRLFAVWKDGIAGKAATLDGYSYLIWALIELYQADYNIQWLHEAEKLTETALELFGGESGGLYYTGHDISDIPQRGINAYDGAVPSGQSVMAMNLVRLSHLLGRAEWEQRARNLIGSLADDASMNPTGFTFLLAAHEYISDGGINISIADGEGVDELLGSLGEYRPYMTVRMVKEDDNIKGIKPIDGRAAAYVCANKTCYPPVTTAEELVNLIKKDGIYK